MMGRRTIFDEPHHQSLELLAARALADGNAAAAFRLADRRCRIAPPPEPHSYVLRGEAAFRLGDQTAAVADAARAIARDPDNIAANRRMLVWGKGLQRIRAARVLVERDSDVDVLQQAISLLRLEGQTAFASVCVLERRIEGWAVWDTAAELEIRIADDEASTVVRCAPDPWHPLRGGGHAASFDMMRPVSAQPQSIVLSVGRQLIHSARAAATMAPARRPQIVRQARPDRQVTVIVPIYADYASTRACLDPLLVELRRSRHRAILVDDATPDPLIAAYVTEIAAKPRIELLTNARNLGFVGSVNRALAHADAGDVVLLNADTIVPPGFIDRLAVAAHSSPDIGTVTPLSNNGEFTSFPVPNTSNRLGARDAVLALDRLAAKANAGTIVDIPSGIGFCLYITEACRDSTGHLSEDFCRGYLEDAEFCLRARANGFRNVCAASVYVGHAGAKSFGADKRSLVVRNLGVLERRFPTHRAECAAFVLADPLRPARQAIECLAPADTRQPTLLISGTGSALAVARERARQLATEGCGALILELHHLDDGARIDVVDPTGGLPQSLQFDLRSCRGRDALADYLRRTQPSNCEILDVRNLPAALVGLLRRLDLGYDILVADAASLACDGVKRVVEAAMPDRAIAPSEQALLAGARRILVPCAQAGAFAASILPARQLTMLSANVGSQAPLERRSETRRLGFLPLRVGAREQQLMHALACGLRRQRPDLSITILGAALEDIRLMQIGNVFVTGKIEATELQDVLACHALDAIFVSLAEPLFGHPLLSSAWACGLPMAYLDWSRGEVTPREGDLAIGPDASFEDIGDGLRRWLAES